MLTGEHCSSSTGAHCSWVSTLHSCLVTISFLRVFVCNSMATKLSKAKTHLILQTSFVSSLHSSLSTGLHICFCTFSHLQSNHICDASLFTSSYMSVWYSVWYGWFNIWFLFIYIWYLLVHKGGLVLRLALLLHNGVASGWTSIRALLHFHVATNLHIG